MSVVMVSSGREAVPPAQPCLMGAALMLVLYPQGQPNDLDAPVFYLHD